MFLKTQVFISATNRIDKHTSVIKKSPITSTSWCFKYAKPGHYILNMHSFANISSWTWTPKCVLWTFSFHSSDRRRVIEAKQPKISKLTCACVFLNNTFFLLRVKSLNTPSTHWRFLLICHKRQLTFADVWLVSVRRRQFLLYLQESDHWSVFVVCDSLSKNQTMYQLFRL